MTAHQGVLLEAALDYAARGWPVFPCHWLTGICCSCGGKPNCKPGKHPLTPSGFKDAMTDAEVIRAWWKKWPEANIGLPTGAVTGIVGIDVDDTEAAWPLIKQLLPDYDFSSVPRQKTGRENGWHLIFAHPGSGVHVKTGVKFLPGMDSRGDGGYIMAAPSMHVSGRQYQWKYLPPKEKFPPLPKVLLDAINSPASNGDGTKPRFDTAGALKGVPEGKRRETVFKLACKLRHADVPFDMAEKLVLEAWRNCDPGNHSFTEREALAQVKDAYQRYPSGEDGQETTDINNPQERTDHNPWAHIKKAPEFLAEEDKEIKGLAKDLVVPGSVTTIAAPRGLCKTLIIHGVAYAMATGGLFRGERVEPLRVLLVDRDNPERVVKERLRGWGAANAANFHLLTRGDAPDLKDKKAWENFPVDHYDVVIIDSVGSFTEGITEKEGKETTQVLATVLDLIHRGPAVILLANCTKDALSVKGRGEWSDRVDIIYEGRDATGFTPSGKKPWFQELPDAGEDAWADRSARRKNRTDYRLAFIPSKFRLGAEPEPFCLEVSVPKDQPWTLTDVTADIIKGADDAIEAVKAKEEKRLSDAAKILADAVKDRADAGEPILKTDAENFLHNEGVTRGQARTILETKNGVLWQIEDPGKGHPKPLFPILQTSPDSGADDAAKPRLEREYGGIGLADHAQSGRQGHPPINSALGLDTEAPFASPPNGVISMEQGLNGGQGVSFSNGKGVDSDGFNWETGKQEHGPDRVEKDVDDGFEDVPK
jgi:Bifunctional DNA primase/polymerase, N-terminal/AAA domain